MALRRAKLSFQIEFDDDVTTAEKVAKELDSMLDEVLEDGDVWDDAFFSDEHGSPGVTEIEVDSLLPAEEDHGR